jgi:hypothetical protein
MKALVVERLVLIDDADMRKRIVIKDLLGAFKSVLAKVQLPWKERGTVFNNRLRIACHGVHH